MYHLGFLFYFSSTATADNTHAREVVKKEFRTMENMGQRVRALRVAQGGQPPLIRPHSDLPEVAMNEFNTTGGASVLHALFHPAANCQGKQG